MPDSVERLFLPWEGYNRRLWAQIREQLHSEWTNYEKCYDQVGSFHLQVERISGRISASKSAFFALSATRHLGDKPSDLTFNINYSDQEVWTPTGTELDIWWSILSKDSLNQEPSPLILLQLVFTPSWAQFLWTILLNYVLYPSFTALLLCPLLPGCASHCKAGITVTSPPTFSSSRQHHQQNKGYCSLFLSTKVWLSSCRRSI